MDDLETLRGRRQLTEVAPFAGLPASSWSQRWEVVCFIFPGCDGTCAHCWSASTFLGRIAPVTWHERFWPRVDRHRLRLLKLSGGEPFLHREIGRIARTVVEAMEGQVPVQIFTSGRAFVSLAAGQAGARETAARLLELGVVLPKVEIHMSADEFHAAALARHVDRHRQGQGSLAESEARQRGIPLLQTAVRNILEAGELLSATNPGFGGTRLKVHAAAGRLDYHRHEVYDWIDDETWRTRVVASEGIVRAGRAQDLEGTFHLTHGGPLSLFLLPGARFTRQPLSPQAQRFSDPGGGPPVFLDAARADNADDAGACLVGWWNLVDRVLCGGSAEHALRLIGHPGGWC